MAELVLSVVAEGILAKAMSLASEHIGSAWGFKEELRKLQVSLTKIQAVIHDAEKRQISDKSVRIWLLELKDVAYEADNVLDEFGYEILRQKVESQKREKDLVRERYSLEVAAQFSATSISRYAQLQDQSNCRKVPRQKCPGVANYCGTLAEMKGGFGYVTKSNAGSLLLFFHMQPNGMQLGFCRLVSII